MDTRTSGSSMTYPNGTSSKLEQEDQILFFSGRCPGREDQQESPVCLRPGGEGVFGSATKVAIRISNL